MRASLFLISLALSSAACSDSEQYAERTGVADRPVAASTVEPGSEPAEAVNFTDTQTSQDATREFAYSWPAEVAAVPALAKSLAAERDRRLAEQKEEWQKSLAQSPPDCVSCRNRGYEKEWQVVADLPDWLSLSSKTYEFTGGAHGTYGKTSLVWNRRTGVGMTGADMFLSPVALESALGSKLCDALNDARARRRGGPVEGGEEWPNDCPGLDEATVFVGSSNGQIFDRIGIYFGPYVAGPYAEGDYELDFPVTASVLDAVKRDYARAFSVKR